MRVTGRGIAAAAAGAALTMVLAGCGGESHSSAAGASQAGDKAANKRTDAPTVLMAAAKKTAEQASYRTIQTGEGGSDKSEMLFQQQPYASSIT